MTDTRETRLREIEAKYPQIFHLLLGLGISPIELARCLRDLLRVDEFGTGTGTNSPAACDMREVAFEYVERIPFAFREE